MMTLNLLSGLIPRDKALMTPPKNSTSNTDPFSPRNEVEDSDKETGNCNSDDSAVWDPQFDVSVPLAKFGYPFLKPTMELYQWMKMNLEEDVMTYLVRTYHPYIRRGVLPFPAPSYSSAVATVTDQPDRSFLLFTKLPTEFRALIWEFAYHNQITDL
jgi:hypothetical protein